VNDFVALQLSLPYESLFSPTSIGGVDLANRAAVAPMTRVSATAEGVPTDRMANYY
jgi:2,4-dienoyl-CoA reductase-like NADH-dependent reductase (Old Yellow Enzyme family)